MGHAGPESRALWVIRLCLLGLLSRRSLVVMSDDSMSRLSGLLIEFSARSILIVAFPYHC